MGTCTFTPYDHLFIWHSCGVQCYFIESSSVGVHGRCRVWAEPRLLCRPPRQNLHLASLVTWQQHGSPWIRCPPLLHRAVYQWLALQQHQQLQRRKTHQEHVRQGRMTVWYTLTHFMETHLAAVNMFYSGQKWSFDNPSEWHFHHQSHDANVATNRIGLDSEKQLTLRKCASPETFHELIHLNKGTLQRETITDSLLSGRKKLFFCPFPVNMSTTVLSCCNSQWST